ncbi:MAG TPA: ATP-binding protein [Terriglobia bacterium]|nr:ATP-binding protein [Terriglobia bacterium]
MRVSLKSKLTALISFLVLVVVLATSTLYISSLTRQNLAEIRDRGKYVANEVYDQARTVLAQSKMPPGANPDDPQELHQFVQQTLSTDPGLASLMDSAVGYSPTIYYVAVTDADLNALLHSDPDEIGHRFAPAQSYDDLMHAGLYHQLRVIYGPPQVYEVSLPLDMGGKPLGDIRIGASTLFLRDQITPELRRALTISAWAILLATITAAILSFRMLRPLQTISQSLDRMSRGEYTKALRLQRQDEWGILSSKLDLLGERMEGEKAAFNALQENLDHLFSKLTDGLMLFDKHDRLVVATPVVGRFLNRTPDTMVHRVASELFTTDHPLDQYLKEIFAARRSQPWQGMELVIDGETQKVEISVQFVEEGGEAVASLVTLRDSSSRAQLEDQLDVAAKLAAIGRLTSGVAHEVKNPLNAMILALEILKTKLGGENDLLKPQLDILTEEIRRLDRVVKTFLDFTRPVELRPTSINLASLVTEVFSLAEPQARRNNVRLALSPNGKLPLVRVDRDLMKQALLNLVLNGCQAMPNGGELRVTPQVSAQHVTLEIADRGTGIPAEVRDKIFSLYFTTKPGGTGVGLAMTSRIIQLHNGSIDFSSEINRGTTFRIMLPR